MRGAGGAGGVPKILLRSSSGCLVRDLVSLMETGRWKLVFRYDVDLDLSLLSL